MMLFNLYFSTFLNSMICNIITDITDVIIIFVFNLCMIYFIIIKYIHILLIFSGNNVPPYIPIDETCIRVTRCQTTTGYLVNGHYLRRR